MQYIIIVLKEGRLKVFVWKECHMMTNQVMWAPSEEVFFLDLTHSDYCQFRPSLMYCGLTLLRLLFLYCVFCPKSMLCLSSRHTGQFACQLCKCLWDAPLSWLHRKTGCKHSTDGIYKSHMENCKENVKCLKKMLNAWNKKPWKFEPIRLLLVVTNFDYCDVNR